jgi:hypothetical protein
MLAYYFDEWKSLGVAGAAEALWKKRLKFKGVARAFRQFIDG